MSNQHKRVNFSIYLDPVNSASDRFAMGTLRKWVEERKELTTNPTSGWELHHRLHMHKDIYLSGMFLYLLSPKLCELLATSLSNETNNIDMLSMQMQACGFSLERDRKLFIEDEILTPILDKVNPILDELGDLKHYLSETMSIVNQENRSGIDDLQHLLEKLSELSLKMEKNIDINCDNNTINTDILELKSMLITQSQILNNISSNNMAEKRIHPQEKELSDRIAAVKKLKKRGLF
ncbi:hypothetical protein VP758_005270 [Vibrio harveyi]|nr:hypothetical protein [Vibrio harveyi]